MTPAAIVSKLWNFGNVLRDDGMSYGDYVEQRMAQSIMQHTPSAGVTQHCQELFGYAGYLG